MKHCIVIIFLLQISIASYAQKSVWQTQINSMEASPNHKASILQCKKILALKNIGMADKIAIQTCLLHRYQGLHLWDTCLQYCKTEIELARQENNTFAQASLYKLMGNTYYYIPKKELAKEYWLKSIDISKQYKYDELTEMCMHNIGSLIVESATNYAEAEKYFMDAIAIGNTLKIKNEDNMNLHYRVLATMYTQQKKYNNAEKIYVELIKRNSALADTSRLVGTMIFYAELLSCKNENEKALELSNQTVAIARRRDVLDMLPTALQFNGKILYNMKRYKEACAVKDELEKNTRTRFDMNLNTKISEAGIKFKNAEIKHEKEVALLQAKKRNQIYLLTFLGLLSVTGFGVYYYLQKKKQKQLQELQTQKLQSIIDGEEKERTRIAKDLHDGIVQDLTAIKLQLNNAINANGHINETVVSDASKAIDKASKEVRNISYQMMPATLRELGFIPAIDDLLKRVVSASNIEYEFEHIGIDTRLPEKIEVSIFRIIQELLNNVLKHSGATLVSLLITQKDNMITMIFEDNGKGFDETIVKHGIGLSSLSSRVELLHGNINYENTNGAGTVAIVRVPLLDNDL